MPKVFAFIFARGGSKGIPRKNLRPLAGKPLLVHAIETARASKHIQRVIVSTDDPEIAALARAHDAEVPALRPAELASDTAPEWLAWRHAIRELAPEPFDIFVTLPPTGKVVRRQDAPAVFDMTTIAYAARPDFILREAGLFAGRAKAVLVPAERALDIDTPLDFELAEFLLARKR